MVEVKFMKHFSWILRIFHIFVLYAWIAFILLFPANPVFSLQLYVLLNILFALVFTGFLITQIVEAFKIFKSEDSEQCIKAFLFFKYSSLPAVLVFLAIFLVVLLGGIGLSFVLLVLPATLFIAPFFFAMSLVVAPLFLGISFMAGLAGLSYAICLILLSRKEKGWTLGQCILHFIFQCIPGFDILDALYITVRYWNRGKILSIITAICVILSIVFAVFLHS